MIGWVPPWVFVCGGYFFAFTKYVSESVNIPLEVLMDCHCVCDLTMVECEHLQIVDKVKEKMETLLWTKFYNILNPESELN